MTILESLRLRGQLLQNIRSYFVNEGLTEVTTPILNKFGSCEPTIKNLMLSEGKRCYLRTSPESCLKQLLAQDVGDIFEIGPAFRDEESTRLHLQEFTMIEWYRGNVELPELIYDVQKLLRACGYLEDIATISYGEIFFNASGLDPHDCTSAELAVCAKDKGVVLEDDDLDDKGLLLDAVYVSTVEPFLRSHNPVFLIEYPVEHRAYARLSDSYNQTARRFELVINGIEVANGYDEVIDATEQNFLFNSENATRERRGLEQIKPDILWLNALHSDISRMCGVALGLERLEMILKNVNHIRKTGRFFN